MEGECVGVGGNAPFSESSETISTLFEYSSTKLPMPNRKGLSGRTCFVFVSGK